MNKMDYDCEEPDEEDDQEIENDPFVCPKCATVLSVRWTGGDNVVNVGKAATFTRVDWYECEKCGYKWSESYDHE